MIQQNERQRNVIGTYRTELIPISYFFLENYDNRFTKLKLGRLNYSERFIRKLGEIRKDSKYLGNKNKQVDYLGASDIAEILINDPSTLKCRPIPKKDQKILIEIDHMENGSFEFEVMYRSSS